MTPGPKNSITDIAGLKVGNAQDDRLKSGTTVLVGDAPYYAKFGFVRLTGVTMPPPTNPERVLGLGDWAQITGDVTRWGG